MARETMKKIINIMKDLNQTKDTTFGVIAFLKTEDNAQIMINWLEENKYKKPSQHEILTKLDQITGIYYKNET